MSNLAVSPRQLFENPAVQERFHNMLKENAAGFITSVISIVNDSKELQKVDSQSLLYAAANAASMNLPVNPNLGFAYIIPYKGKAQFQMGYKGFIQLGMRSGQYKTIGASEIYTNQIVKANPLTGYEFDFSVTPEGEIVGYAGYFQLVNGFEKTYYMTIDQLQKHGLKYSQTYKKGFGLWKDEFDSMAIKTVLKLMLSKYGLLSIEMQRALQTDQAVINDWDGNSDYVDNRKLSAEENNKEIEEQTLKEWIEKAETLEKLAEANTGVYGSDDDELIQLYESKQKQLLTTEAEVAV